MIDGNVNSLSNYFLDRNEPFQAEQKISNEALQAAKISLLEAELTAEERYSDRGAWRVGGKLTTGICAAHGFQSVDHVEKYLHEEEIPPLIEDNPSETMKYLEMLLPLSIYQSLEEGQTYKNAVFNEKGKAIVNRSCQTYARLINEETGLSIVARYPSDNNKIPLDFNTGMQFEDLKNNIDTIFREGKHSHCLFSFRNPDAELIASHVVYVNMREGIISDGGTGLIWKIPKQYKAMFPEILKDYFNRHYKMSFSETQILAVEKTSAPKPWPLAFRKIALYASLLFNMLKREGVKESAAAALVIMKEANVTAIVKVDPNTLIEKIKRLAVLIFDMIRAAFSQNQAQIVLCKACEEGNIFKINWAIRQGANVNLLYNERIPLAIAAKSGHLDVVKRLVELGATLAPTSAFQSSAELSSIAVFFAACEADSLEIVEYLLENNRVKPGPRDLLAACRGVENPARLKIVEKLLSHIDLNDVGFKEDPFFSHSSPLKSALLNKSRGIIGLLIQHGTDPNIVLSEALCDWSSAISSAHSVDELRAAQYRAIIKIAIENGVNLTNPSRPLQDFLQNELIDACKLGDLFTVESLLKLGANPYLSFIERSPLASAAKSGQLEIIKYLIKAGRQFKIDEKDVKNAYGFALAEACETNAPMDAINLLLELGVNPNRIPTDGWRSPFAAAVANKRIDVVKRFIELGSTPPQSSDVATRPGALHIYELFQQSPLAAACYKKQLETVDILLNAGVKPGPRDLFAICDTSDSIEKCAIVKLLLDAGVNPLDKAFQEDNLLRSELPLLRILVRTHSLPALKLLVQRAPDLIDQIKKDSYLLYKAVQDWHVGRKEPEAAKAASVIEFLISHGADPQKLDPRKERKWYEKFIKQRNV